MRYYTVNEAFQLLKNYKITSHKESVRRWLREGIIKGTSPRSRKEGWTIQENDLMDFIRSRMPDEGFSDSFNTTNVLKEEAQSRIRTEMWWELVRKNIFEYFIEVKKTQVRACVEHIGYSKTFEDYVWQSIKQNKRGYATPRIPYLLEAFLFDGRRLLMDKNYENKDEQIIFAVLEYLRQQKVNKKNNY